MWANPYWGRYWPDGYWVPAIAPPEVPFGGTFSPNPHPFQFKVRHNKVRFLVATETGLE